MARKKKDAGQGKRDEARPLFREGELPPAPDRFAKEAFDIYNEVAARVGWAVTENLTEVRQKKLLKAIHDCGSVAAWAKAMERAAASGLLTGKRKNLRYPVGFMAKLDFFLRSDKRTALLDGEYDDVKPTSNVMREIRALPTPAPKVAATQEPFVLEPREVRLAAMIATYRKYGKWADANRIETELAALEGRPATHVPDPSVAREGLPEETRPAPAKAPIVTDLPVDVRPADSSVSRPMRDSQKSTGRMRDNISPTITDVVPDWTAEEVPASAYHEVEA